MKNLKFKFTAFTLAVATLIAKVFVISSNHPIFTTNKYLCKYFRQI